MFKYYYILHKFMSNITKNNNIAQQNKITLQYVIKKLYWTVYFFIATILILSDILSIFGLLMVAYSIFQHDELKEMLLIGHTKRWYHKICKVCDKMRNMSDFTCFVCGSKLEMYRP